MSRKRGAALAAAALIAVLLIAASVVPSAAQEPPLPVATPLTERAVFTDNVDLKFKVKLDDEVTRVKVKKPSRTAVVRFTLEPGAQFPWHTHRGPVVVNVDQGGLTYVGAEDCKDRVYPARTAFVDPGRGHVHTAFNHTDGETVLVATFYQAPPAPAPLLIPADEPEDCVVP